MGGGKNKVRTHTVVGSLVLFVDVLDFIGVLLIMVIGLLFISVGIPDKHCLRLLLGFHVICCPAVLSHGALGVL